MTRLQLKFYAIFAAAMLLLGCWDVCAPQQLGVLPQRTMGDGYPILTPGDQTAYHEAIEAVDDAGYHHSPTLAAKRFQLKALTRIYVKWCAPLAIFVVNQQGWAQCALKVKPTK